MALYHALRQSNPKLKLDANAIKSFRLPGVIAKHEITLADDYQNFVLNETKAFQQKMLERQGELIKELENCQNAANLPQSDTTGKSDKVVLERDDYEKLKEQISVISKIHPEISNNV